MPVAAELVFTRKALLLKITISPLFPPDAGERAWAGALSSLWNHSLSCDRREKASFYFKITFNYRPSISTFKNLQVIWVIDINEIC